MYPAQRAWLFDRHLLSGDTGFAAESTSPVIAVEGNAVVVSASVINAAGLDATHKLVISAEGSYDMRAWSPISSASVEFTAAELREKHSTRRDDIDVPYLRLRAALDAAATGVTALFDASVVTSHQA